MKEQNTFTFIISKSYGHPISWSMPGWQVFFGGGILLVLLLAMTAMSAMFLVVYPRMLEFREQRDLLQKERSALREQNLSANQEALDAKEESIARRDPGGSPDNGAESTAQQPLGEEGYLPPIRITSVKTSVLRDEVEVVFRMVRQGAVERNRGGFLFAVFENQEKSPPVYTASPNVPTNGAGFPESYKSGIRFPRFREAIVFRRRVRRRGREEFFTHVTLYLFSLRGGLLAKDRFELDREQFRPGVLPRQRLTRKT